MKSTLRFTFGAVPNIDFGEDTHLGTVRLPVRRFGAGSLREAKEKYRALISMYQLGGGNLSKECGLVFDASGKQIARISYNGRVWDMGNHEIQLED